MREERKAENCEWFSSQQPAASSQQLELSLVLARG
jgi:hypothetical protein